MKKSYVIDGIDVSCDKLFEMTHRGKLPKTMKRLSQITRFEFEPAINGNEQVNCTMYDPVIPLPRVFMSMAKSFATLQETTTFYPEEKKTKFEVRPVCGSNKCLYKIMGKSYYKKNSKDPQKTDLTVKIKVAVNRKLLKQRVTYIPNMGLDMLSSLLEKVIVENMVKKTKVLHRNINA